jgi:hypothetical protein
VPNFGGEQRGKRRSSRTTPLLQSHNSNPTCATTRFNPEEAALPFPHLRPTHLLRPHSTPEKARPILPTPDTERALREKTNHLDSLFHEHLPRRRLDRVRTGRHSRQVSCRRPWRFPRRSCQRVGHGPFRAWQFHEASVSLVSMTERPRECEGARGKALDVGRRMLNVGMGRWQRKCGKRRHFSPCRVPPVGTASPARFDHPSHHPPTYPRLHFSLFQIVSHRVTSESRLSSRNYATLPLLTASRL